MLLRLYNSLYFNFIYYLSIRRWWPLFIRRNVFVYKITKKKKKTIVQYISWNYNIVPSITNRALLPTNRFLCHILIFHRLLHKAKNISQNVRLLLLISYGEMRKKYSFIIWTHSQLLITFYFTQKIEEFISNKPFVRLS